MVEPGGFRANPETAADNAFQAGGGDRVDPAVEAAARVEWAALRRLLEDRGIEVVVFPADGDETPDALFPNNWFSTHPDGTLVLYPMRAENRRRERRPPVVGWLRDRSARVIDLTGEERRGRALEGTGSLVVDERARRAYACASPRTSPELAAAWASRTGYGVRVFTARGPDGRAIYHTNVLLSVGEGFAVLCADVVEPAERESLRALLAEGGRDVVEITPEQMRDFCANALEVANAAGARYFVMSSRAAAALTPAQRARIEAHAEIVHTDLSTIEAHGGGGARCMLAELY